MTDTPDRPGEHGRQEDEPTLQHRPFSDAASSPESAAEGETSAERPAPESASERPTSEQTADGVPIMP